MLAPTIPRGILGHWPSAPWIANIQVPALRGGPWNEWSAWRDRSAHLPLLYPSPTRQWRNGCRLRSARHPASAFGGDQVPEAHPVGGCTRAQTLQARGAAGLLAQSSQHLHHPGRRGRRRSGLHRDGTPAREQPEGPACRWSAAARRDSRHWRAGRRRARRCPRRGHHSSRHQAGQRVSYRERTGQAARLRSRQALSDERWQCTGDGQPDGRGRRGRDAPVHVARAARRGCTGGLPMRSVCAWCPPVRDGNWHAPVRQLARRWPCLGDPVPAARAAATTVARVPSGARANHRQTSRQATRRPVPVSPHPAERSRGAGRHTERAEALGNATPEARAAIGRPARGIAHCSR